MSREPPVGAHIVLSAIEIFTLCTLTRADIRNPNVLADIHPTNQTPGLCHDFLSVLYIYLNLSCLHNSLTLQSRPPLDLAHAAFLEEGLVHVEGVEEEVGLVAHALAEALELGLLEVVAQDGLVLVVRAALDDEAGALARAEAAHIGETGLRHHDVQVVLRLVDVRAHGHDAGHAVLVGLRRPRRRRVHNAVLGGPQEVGRSAETVQHPAAHHVRAVGVRVDVHLDGSVHADDAQPADDLGRVGHLLRPQQKLVVVRLPVVIEALEAVGGEADTGGRGEVESARVEQVQESVLDDLGPDLEVPEVTLAQATNDGVGDVADTGLQG